MGIRGILFTDGRSLRSLSRESRGGRIPLTREDYRRLEGFVGDRELAAPSGEPLGRYLLVNFALLGMGLAAWSGLIAALIWILF